MVANALLDWVIQFTVTDPDDGLGCVLENGSEGAAHGPAKAGDESHNTIPTPHKHRMYFFPH